ncbi:hypothetical protein CRUP_031573 [Coryphaenoides rupestris]|nr:hypothetical protein CRUP_031573 [Coryphaenoides rupestris]
MAACCTTSSCSSTRGKWKSVHSTATVAKSGEQDACRHVGNEALKELTRLSTRSTRPHSDDEYRDSAVCSRRSLAPRLPCRRLITHSWYSFFWISDTCFSSLAHRFSSTCGARGHVTRVKAKSSSQLASSGRACSREALARVLTSTSPVVSLVRASSASRS